MKVHYIVESDLIAKAISIAPTIDIKDDVPTLNSLLSYFGGFSMKIRATLDPIDLMYFLESKHVIEYETVDEDKNVVGVINLTIGDIFYHIPSIFFEYIYDGHTESDIYSDEILCGLIGESFGNDAKRRFANNKFIDHITTDDGMFDGYTMTMIGLDNTSHMIPPSSPDNKIQENIQKDFEVCLMDRVIDAHEDGSTVDVFGLFSKRVSFSELIDLIITGATIDSINYSIHQMIADDIISESMYGINKVKNLVGDEHETIEFDATAVNHVIDTDAKIGVMVKVVNKYKINDTDATIIDYQNDLQGYLNDVMYDNIQSVIDTFEIAIEKEEDIIDDVEEFEDEPTIDDSDDIYDEKEFSLINDKSVDDTFSLLNETLSNLTDTEDDISLINEENVEDNTVDTIDEVEEHDESQQINISSTELAFYVSHATFNSISMIERNEEFQTDGTVGVVAMDYSNGIPQTFMLGTPVKYEMDEITRFNWTTIDYDRFFNDAETEAYRVKHWYNADGTVEDGVLLMDYNEDLTNIGGEVNVKTVKC